MTPTDELCARLNELGVRYTTDDSNDYEIIEWQGPYNLWWQFVYDPYEEEPYGELRLLEAGGSTHLTPEQAINATVGTGTCNIEKTHGKSPIDGKEIVIYKCSECGTLIGADSRYCNQCGDRVVSE